MLRGLKSLCLPVSDSLPPSGKGRYHELTRCASENVVMRKYPNLIALMIVVLSLPSVKAVEGEPDVITPIIDGVELARSCWYGGKRYSEGSPLKVDGLLLVCMSKHDHETNGEVIWRDPLKKPKPKIQINQ